MTTSHTPPGNEERTRNLLELMAACARQAKAIETLLAFVERVAATGPCAKLRDLAPGTLLVNCGCNQCEARALLATLTPKAIP